MNIALWLVLALGVVFALLAIFARDATRIAFSLERKRCGLRLKSTAVDGETWHYLEGGAADAPVLLLLHGFGGDKDHWTRFSRALVRDYRVIAPDLPGFGDSARHAGWDYSLNAQRDRLNEFIAALKLGPLHLGGNSMGGHLAVIYALVAAQIDTQILAVFGNGAQAWAQLIQRYGLV